MKQHSLQSKCKKQRLIILIAAVLFTFILSKGLAGANELILGAAESPEESAQMKRTELILKEAFKRIGYEVELKKYPAARCLKYSNSGIIDGEAQRIYDLNKNHKYTLNNLIRVPEPHQSMDLSAFVYNRNDIILDPKDPYLSLKNYKVIVKIGIVNAEENIMRVGIEKVDKVRKYDQMFKMLMSGRGDVAIGFSEMTKKGGMLTKGEFKGKPFKMLTPPLNYTPLYVYLHKKHQDIVPLVSSALREMKNDGTFQKIVNN